MVTEEQIQQHYDKFIEYIKADSRAEQLMQMYEDFTAELTTAPASGKTYFHNAFPGGYIDHIFNVCRNALKVKQLFISKIFIFLSKII